MLLSAFVCGGSAFADETTTDDGFTVVDGVAQINDYSAFCKVVTDNNRKAELEGEIKNLKDQIPAEPTRWIETVTIDEEDITYTNPVYTTIRAFLDTYTANTGKDETDPNKSNTIWYRLLKEYEFDASQATYYVYVTNESVKQAVETNEKTYTTILKDEETKIPYTEDDLKEAGYSFYIKQDDGTIVEKMREWASDWQSISYNSYIGTPSLSRPNKFAFKDNETKVPVIKVVLAYLKQKNAENTDPEYTFSGQGVVGDNAKFYDSGIRTAMETLLKEEGLVYKETIKTPVTHRTESQNWKEWDESTRDDREALKTKQTEYDGITVYKELKLTKDIEVTDRKTANITWPKGYILDGDFHRIDGLGIGSGSTLFSSNEGTIRNAISQDGRFVNTLGGGSVTDCIVKTAQSAYRVYDDQGASLLYNDNSNNGDNSNDDNLVKAIYKMGEYYGYSFSDKKAGAVTDANRLYQAQYANATNKTVSSFKVNINTTGFEYDATKSEVAELSRDNTVVYIDDVDPYATSAVAELRNVAVKKGSTYVCANAELSDGQASNEFYVPFAFTATNLTYDRSVKTQYVSVCLPFALDAAKLKTMGAKAYTYAYVDSKTGRMKFSPIATVAANTPCILAFTEAAEKSLFAEGALKGVTVASTSGADLTSGDSFYGNYKAYQTAAELAGDKTGTYVYGVQKDKFVKMADNSHMNAFRSFVCLSEDISQSSTGEARSFTISLLDEDGNEEVTGIELVSTADNGTADFKAVGGRNAIEITTGKACDVKVYTLNGALAKTARVEAGTTTLPMNAGMYVVNKTKVIVK